MELEHPLLGDSILASVVKCLEVLLWKKMGS